jgi:hypothetical protein
MTHVFISHSPEVSVSRWVQQRVNRHAADGGTEEPPSDQDRAKLPVGVLLRL